MNDLKDLIIAVDGYSFDKTGFEVTEFYKGSGNFWRFFIKAYKKEGKDFISESKIGIFTLVDRIENKCDTHNYEWKVVKIEELIPGSFELMIEKVTDEKADSSDKEEHMEDEK